jgi:hypothetical protein
VSDQPTQPPNAPNQRFKADMPQIPGLAATPTRSAGIGGPLLVIAGLLAVLAAVFIGGKFFAKSHHTDPPPAPPAQIDIPAPVADITPAVPVATEQDPVIASVTELKPWASKRFTFRNRMTNENVSAILVRLPSGSPAQASGYWSFSLKAAFGTCRLEYVNDLQKIKSDYGYSQAKHPMVGNPCSRTLFDPLRYATIPGNVLVRGAMVQGSDLRPPLGVELKLKGKDILAIRME